MKVEILKQSESRGRTEMLTLWPLVVLMLIALAVVCAMARAICHVQPCSDASRAPEEVVTIGF